MDEKFAWDPTWQLYIMLNGNGGYLLRTTLEDKHDENYNKNLGLPWSFKNHGLMPLV